MADNPYSVQVVNPLQALLLGEQSYKAAQEGQQQDALKQARSQAAQLYQAGDTKGALAKLLGASDLQGAGTYSTLDNNAWNRQHTEKQDARQAGRDAISDQHWQASFGLQKRAADRADDPTPDNFVADASVPGGYRPIGPADPAYLAKVEAEKAKAKADVPTVIGAGSSVIIPNKASEGAIFTNKPTDDGLSTAARDIKARQLINGDMSALQNVGRGAQAGKTLEGISNRAAEILTEENGMTPQEAAAHLGQKIQAFKASSMGQGAEARTAGVREANLNLILRAADAAIPAALEASDAVARTGWVPVNKIIQHGEVMASNPDLKRFGMANLQLAEHWARAMNPTGVMRESDRDKALEFLSTADSPQTYRAAVGQLKTQITRERDAVRGAPVTPPSPSFSGGKPPSQGNGADAMIQHARDAIAQGAPKDAVIKRLNDAGIDASGL